MSYDAVTVRCQTLFRGVAGQIPVIGTTFHGLSNQGTQLKARQVEVRTTRT